MVHGEDIETDTDDVLLLVLIFRTSLCGILLLLNLFWLLDLLLQYLRDMILIFSDDFPISEDKLLVGEIWIIDMDDLLPTNTAGDAAPGARWIAEEEDKCQ